MCNVYRRCAMSLGLMAGLLMGVGLLLRPAAPASAASPPSVQSVVALCFPFTPNEPQADQTTLYLTNAGTSAASLTVSFYHQDGSLAASPLALQIPAGGTDVLDLAAYPGVPAGVFHTIVGASGPLVGAAHVRSSETGLVAVYQAVDCGQDSDTLFIPYAGSLQTAYSALYLVNGGAAAAQLQPVFVAMGGTAVYTAPLLSLAPGAGTVIADDTLGVTLPPDVYSIELTTTAPSLAGVLLTRVGDVTTLANALVHGQPAAQGMGALQSLQAMEPAVSSVAALPRLYVRENIDGTSFSTNLLLRNRAAEASVASVYFYKADGSQGGPPVVEQLPARGAKAYAFENVFSLPNGAHSLVAGSNYPLALEGIVAADDPAAAAHAADSFVVQPAATRLLLPGIVSKDGLFTILAVQNLAASPVDVTVNLLGALGNSVSTVQGQLMPGAALSLDLRTVAGLPPGFAGSALITSNQDVIAQVDTFSQRIIRKPPAGIAIAGPDVAPRSWPLSYTAVVSPTDANKPITFTWQTSEMPPLVRVSTSGEDTVMLGWNIPGSKTIVVTATNEVGSASAEYSVAVTSEPQDVTITGPATALPGEPLEFTATVSPPEADKPITYTWAPEGLPAIVRVSPDGEDEVTLSWPDAGTRTVVVTATNRWGSASAAAGVRVLAAPQTLSIAGPALALPGAPVTFTVVVSPADAATPITYTWYADDLTPTVHVSDDSQDQVALTWTAAGSKRVTVEAANLLATASTAVTVEVPAAGGVTTGEPFSITAPAPGGGEVTLDVPAGGATAGYTITATPVDVQQVITGEDPITGVNLLGVAVVLQAWSGEQLLPGFQFDQPAALLIRYTDAQAGRDEMTLRIFTLQDGAWIDAAATCDPASAYVRRPEQNELAVPICHLSPYVLAEPAIWLYLPSIAQ